MGGNKLSFKGEKLILMPKASEVGFLSSNSNTFVGLLLLHSFPAAGKVSSEQKLKDMNSFLEFANKYRKISKDLKMAVTNATNY